MFLACLFSCLNPHIGFGDDILNADFVVVDNPIEEEPEEEEEVIIEPVFDCSQTVFLKSQAEVDAFGLEGCPEVENLWIEEIDGPIFNLHKLTSLVKINGFLSIQDTSISDFEGLQNVTQLNGSLLIEHNPELFVVFGLQNITRLTELSIINNEGLTSIFSLNGLTSLRNLTIRENNALTELEGLQNLKSVEQHILIQENNFLSNIYDLDNIINANNISIMGNDRLTDFCPLKNLLQSTNFTGDFITNFNGYNPTYEDVVTGNCSL
ncbi:hypothetical protein LPB138_09500 [Urechidicola croceus]|uniref:Receptor L-domain domain-containing protein n=2 Tax=Urechidicola croceus TaxID=1850246 RepID=A0A1D8P8M0_9FLAO|nr:hypothetical protein LPB138_09500 [Urechidicola croceus]